uniref:Uncharacterized protein n=1 Tax=Opuntia streptacantha TaxID=393608 RepID=A0A7C9CHU1_OPUST
MDVILQSCPILAMFFSLVNPVLSTSTHFNLFQSISTHTTKNFQSFSTLPIQPISTNLYQSPSKFNPILLYFKQLQRPSTFFNSFQPTSTHQHKEISASAIFDPRLSIST